MTARFLVGDVFDVAPTLEDGSVDLILTSPPFLALRSYLPPDHPAKGSEIGAEPTPADFVDRLLDVVEVLAPKLAPHGSICFELGDTYAGSGGAGGDYGEGGLREGQQRFDGSASRAFGTGAAPRPARAGRARSPRPKYRDAGRQRDRDRDEAAGVIPQRTHSRRERPGWPMDKSLCGIPEAFRLSLIYGWNVLRPPGEPVVDDYGTEVFPGARFTPRWRARNVIRWCRPNPPVGALGDKVRPATSDMVILCRSRRRYFDLDAVRTPLTEPDRRFRHQEDPNPSHGWAESGQTEGFAQNGAGAPPLDHWWHDDVFGQDAWMLATAPYKGAHYATWPAELLVKPILAMVPPKVCTTCGEPSRRLLEAVRVRTSDGLEDPPRVPSKRNEAEPSASIGQRNQVDTFYRTVGWSDCGHGTWRPGVILDPFCGSGTTMMVALGHGRSAIGIDLDDRNVHLAQERCGMFLEVDDARRPVADVPTGGLL